MNLTFLNKTDLELNSMRDWQHSDGREIRREIKRRKLIGFADGTMFATAKAVVETEARVGTVTVVMPAARKVEKRMAGRGR
jgi:hypothetical protein|tara:strand:+ start:324 stop:566 length:243 start_codon:yes stop_codon:yes gene_type:complete